VNEIQPFVFPETGRQVRMVLVDGKPWFVGRDVAANLGYANPRDALAKHVPARHKGESRIATPSGEQTMAVISEPGLYRLIMRSNAEHAERFQEWVTEVVLPSIRENGSFALQRTLPKSYAAALRELAATVEERDTIRGELQVAAPKADSWDTLAEARGDFSVRDAAQILDRDGGIEIGQNRLFAYLREIKWLDKGGTPYQRIVDKGWLRTRARSYEHPRTGESTLARPQIRVTVKGVHELHRLLGGNGPLIFAADGAA
jgi:anti-repressor protein